MPKKAVIKKSKVGKRKVTLRFKVKPAKTGGSKYQIKARAFRKVGKKKYYGKWSKVKVTKKIRKK